MLTEDQKQSVRTFYTRIGAALPGFRSRRGQREMIAAISNALGRARLVEDQPAEGQNIVVVEGRTGVGKTVGYLVPVLALAKQLNKKVIISTATVALQEQLYSRDIPALLAQMDSPLSAHLAKGRRRYVCLTRLDQYAGDAEQTSLFGDDGAWDRRPEEREIRLLRTLRTSHAEQKWSGDRDTLPEPVPEELWQRITTDSPGCIGRRCSAFAKCPFQLARAAQFKADLIVTNHDFVLSCLASGSSQLPPLDEAIVVFDEAHHLPKVAVARFALNSPLTATKRWVDRASIILGRVLAMISASEESKPIEQSIALLSRALSDYGAAMKRDMAAFGAKGVLRFPFGRLDEAHATLAAAIAVPAADLLKKASRCADAFDDALAKGRVSATSGETAMRDLAPLLARIEALVAFWTSYAAKDDPDAPPMARWIEAVDGGSEFILNVSPISAARTLINHVWTKASAAVLASATLRTLGDFRYFLSKTGLSALPHVEAVAVTAPFNYPEQGELHVPRLRADPKDAAAHTAEICALMPQLLQTTSGGTLALFASRRQMEQVYGALPPALQADVLMQGVKSRAALLAEHGERVRAGRRSVLFGLAGMGEGLDLPGHLCEHVVIAKLPFAPPDSPLEEAAAEWIEHKGGNAFAQLFLPNAGLILVQWVGRLIRTEEDHGRITILDSRILTKGYGRRLIAGLPEFRRVAA